MGHVYLLSLCAVGAVVAICTLCFHGRVSCQLQQRIWHQHNLSVTCRLPFNWDAEAVPALVSHFSHPSVKCVCACLLFERVCVCVWCHITQVDPEPQINTPSLLYKMPWYLYFLFVFSLSSLSLSHHHLLFSSSCSGFLVCFFFSLSLFFSFDCKNTGFCHEFE